MPHVVSHASPSLCKALIANHASIQLNGTPESDPTCETRLPGSPRLACGAACPCKQSQVLTLCHKPPLLRKALIICHACIHPNGTPETAPTCETRLPGSPCLAVEPLAPASTHNASHWVTCSSSLHKALIAHHACIHPDGTPETAPTGEARPSRSPGLASGAARPCKQSQCLTLCHMPPLLCAKL